MHGDTELILDSSAQESDVDTSEKKQSWLLWPVKGFVLIAAVLTALVLNALTFFSQTSRREIRAHHPEIAPNLP